MADSDEKTSGFKVTDRRTVDPEGQPKAEASPAAGPEDTTRSLPPADFPTLILSLGSSAMMYLGEGHPGQDKPPPKNLPLAKHAIDMLTVLEEKTKGNLTKEEEQILEGLLFDLRLHYVEALKKP